MLANAATQALYREGTSLASPPKATKALKPVKGTKKKAKKKAQMERLVQATIELSGLSVNEPVGSRESTNDHNDDRSDDGRDDEVGLVDDDEYSDNRRPAESTFTFKNSHGAWT